MEGLLQISMYSDISQIVVVVVVGKSRRSKVFQFYINCVSGSVRLRVLCAPILHHA